MYKIMSVLKAVCFTVLVISFFTGCKNRYKACFSFDKVNPLVGETVTIYNCSSYGSSAKRCYWTFDDDTTILTENNDSDTLSYVFVSAGQHIVELWVGNYERGNGTTNTITVQ